jgi:hypothetical protein
MLGSMLGAVAAIVVAEAFIDLLHRNVAVVIAGDLFFDLC